MKLKFFTLIMVLIVLTAVFLSCISIPLPSGESKPETSNNTSSKTSEIPNNSNPNTDNSGETSEPGTSEPATSESETSNTSKPLPASSQSIDWSKKTAAECDEYFKNSVIVGDSVMLGFKNYVGQKRATNTGFFSSLKFHVGGSYGVYNALAPVSSKSVHPLFGGEQTTIEDAVKAMGAERVFILFGLNDLGLYPAGEGPAETLENYKKLFSKIKEKNPNTEIVILSATYLYEPWDKKMVKLTSKNLRALNQLMLEYCNDNGMDYIDVATALADSKGYLRPEYCSDEECHLTNAAYDVWTNILRAYAADKLDGKYSNVSSMTSMFN